MAKISLLIRGEEDKSLLAAGEGADLNLKGVYRIGGTTRGEVKEEKIEVNDKDIVEFVFEDDAVWLSDAAGIEELFPDIKVTTRDGKEAYSLPLSIQSDDTERGIIKDIALKLVKVFTKKATGALARDLAKILENKQLDDQIGLFLLQDDFTFQKPVIKNTTQPCLLFIHGTASSTSGSFDKLTKENTPPWRDIRNQYGENILAFQHRSLTESPLKNVEDLVTQLPKQAVLHIVSHSRGGLVGDILNRFCVNAGGEGFSESEINYLRKNNRDADIATIKNISKLIRTKNIQVQKFIRVACPASGTTLASSRLDFVLNMLFNLIGVVSGQAANPIYIAFKNLLANVVESKDDVNALPGLEAMNPDSPFIEMLNNGVPSAVIGNPLIVIAGNSTGIPTFKRALAVIASKLFYWGKNDFIVDTRSMYNGAKRTQNHVQYFLDEGSDVSHFNYFRNPKTRTALLQALQNDGNTLIPGFQWQEQIPTNEEIRGLAKLQHGKEFRDNVSGKRPIAVLLPGIMGSNLSLKDETIWINYWRFLTGGLTLLEYTERNNANIKPTSLIKTSYKQLGDYFTEQGYDVVTFPFDWRLSLADGADKFDEKLKVLMSYDQPIKIIGHSMGGVLVRDFIIHHKETWKELNKRDGFRVLFLGSPLGGSFRIPYVLFGEDDIIKTLGKVDMRHNKKDLVDIFRNLPGILCLLPLAKDAGSRDYADIKTWNEMVKASADTAWPVPSQESLDAFGTYRDFVLNAMSQLGQEDFKNMTYVAGQNRAGKQTPLDYKIENGKLVFLSTLAGDESVTWDSGIPQQLIAVQQVYYSNVTHGELANDKSLFKPIAEILSKGNTGILKQTRPALRSNTLEFVTKPSYNFDFTPEGIEKTVLGLSGEDRQKQGVVPVNVTVSNGDLKYATYPVLSGHFINDGIFSAEKSIDRYLNGELGRRQQLGLYPGAIGTSEILIAQNRQYPCFKGAIIAGLGQQGELNAFQLSRTVEQAVTNYLTGYNSLEVAIPEPLDAKKKQLGISALIIGCGYGGLKIESSVRAIMQGVQNANDKIRQIYSPAITINEIEFMELLHDRALATVHAIEKIYREEDRNLHIIWKNKAIRKKPGSRERLPVDNTSDWWTRINVRQIEDENNERSSKRRGIRFNVSTDAAREEERTICTGKDTLLEILNQMSTSNQWTSELAKTIFELLIPVEFKDLLKKQNNINWIVDKNTAMYPWELLQDSIGNAAPLSVNSGMIRQLATQDYRININAVIKNTALVIGEPDLEDEKLALPGAAKEGNHVQELLTQKGYNTQYLSHAKASEILISLFAMEYKIVHLSGHGIFSTDPSEPTGMLIGKNAYLTTCEIRQMSSIPELVFVNCCHLGKIEPGQEALMQNRYKMAANIGTQLIEIGVKAVVVAGWAVDDTAAVDFAEKFYECMFDGNNFGDSIRKARKYIYQAYGNRNNTWGAYQCYGDPFYAITQKTTRKEITYEFVISEEAEIELQNLYNQLGLDKNYQENLAILKAITDAVEKGNLRTPRITELEAMIYTGLNQYEPALEKYDALMKLNNAAFMTKTIEQYCNIRGKAFFQRYKKFLQDGKKAEAGKIPSEMDVVIEDLEALLRYGKTSERYLLIASAWKRKAMVLSGRAKIDAYKKAASFYHEAYKIASSGNKIYALTNWLETINGLETKGEYTWNKNKDEMSKAEAIKTLNAELLAHKERLDIAEETSYWDLVPEANLLLCLLMLGDKSVKYADVLIAFEQLWMYAGNYNHKQMELEQMEFLEDLLSISSKQQSAKKDDILLQEVIRLKKDLSNIHQL